MMKEEYFIPDIEDLRVGCEYYFVKDLTKDITEDNLLSFDSNPKRIASMLFPAILWEREETDKFIPNLMSYRIPYLTKKQIEKEGWVDVTLNYQKPFIFVGEKQIGDYFKIVYDYKSHLLNILDVEDNYVFKGQCKSINELRYISKLIQIWKS